MGKANTSRKGKKAWRANISTEDIEDFFEKSTKDGLSAAPSEDLFHVDKSHDLPVKRKIEKHREKVLRCDSVLKKNPFAQIVSFSKPKLKKSKKTISIESKTPKQVQKNDGDDSEMIKKKGLDPLRAIVSADQGSVIRTEQGLGTLADQLRLGSLTEDGLSYKEKFIVRSYEVGSNKTATVETIANLLHEVGCNHAQSVGFSTDGFATTPTMRKLHLIWVTARMHIEIYKYPAWGDVVEIETWCQSEGRIGTRRDWILKDCATGEVTGRATSKWVMMNQDTRRLQKVSDDVRDEYLVFCPQEPRLAFPEENNRSLKKIPKLEDPSQYSMIGLKPRRADLDMNQHVNNVTYIGWVLESIPQEVVETHELQVITMDYRRECQQDDVVDSLTTSEIGGTNGSATSGTQGHNNSQFLMKSKCTDRRMQFKAS